MLCSNRFRFIDMCITYNDGNQRLTASIYFCHSQGSQRIYGKFVIGLLQYGKLQFKENATTTLHHNLQFLDE